MYKKLVSSLRITGLLAAVILSFIFVLGSNSSAVYADDDNGYSNALDDLQKDSGFNAAIYPEKPGDYSIEVIQIAESENNELFVYTYQPGQTAYPIVATDINMSLSDKVGGIVDDGQVVAGSDTSKLYSLTFLNGDGVFVKYKVDNFTVSGDLVRYYTISTIYRDYIEGVDTPSGSDNTKLSQSFPVGKQFVAMTTDSGVAYACKDIDFMEIKNPFVDFLAYGTYDGFDLIFGNVDYTDIHYIAFTPDRQIDTLKEADVTYTTQPYTLNADGFNTGYFYGEKSAPQFKTLTGKEQVGVDGYTEYTWKSIYTAEDFMKTTTLTGEAKEQVENSQFVLVFLATECSVQDLTDWGQGHYQRVSGTKVSDVTILRLMFETNGKTYNLGVVMDIQEGDDTAGNKPVNNGGSCNGIDWRLILGILGFLIILIILAPILPYIIQAIIWVISLPFKGIAALIKAIKKNSKPAGQSKAPEPAVKPKNKRGEK